MAKQDETYQTAVNLLKQYIFQYKNSLYLFEGFTNTDNENSQISCRNLRTRKLEQFPPQKLEEMIAVVGPCIGDHLKMNPHLIDADTFFSRKIQKTIKP